MTKKRWPVPLIFLPGISFLTLFLWPAAPGTVPGLEIATTALVKASTLTISPSGKEFAREGNLIDELTSPWMHALGGTSGDVVHFYGRRPGSAGGPIALAYANNFGAAYVATGSSADRRPETPTPEPDGVLGLVLKMLRSMTE